jgi:hypothetical protein
MKRALVHKKEFWGAWYQFCQLPQNRMLHTEAMGEGGGRRRGRIGTNSKTAVRQSVTPSASKPRQYKKASFSILY